MCFLKLSEALAYVLPDSSDVPSLTVVSIVGRDHGDIDTSVVIRDNSSGRVCVVRDRVSCEEEV